MHTSDKKPQTSQVYDEMYTLHGEKRAYGLPYKHSCYFPLYKKVRRHVIQNKAHKVLEVGCGAGGFAHYLTDTTSIDYLGFDFSSVAINNAIERTGDSEIFYIGDATNIECYPKKYDALVCTEVLEHVDQDLEIIQLWDKGTLCVCSVPNFDSPYHVRHFKDESEVFKRYSGLLNFKSISAIKKPVLEDISLNNVMKNLRWNRYRPERIMELLGLGNFEKVGGWFLFTGIKK
jgi:ubiquinone/menaquinone biosynthesis C-methylase UbiE